MDQVTKNHPRQASDKIEREFFIPLRRADLTRICAGQGSLEAGEFADFCEILQAHLHHDCLVLLEGLKDAYAPFNPDRDTLRVGHDGEEERSAKDLCRQFDEIMSSANYVRVSEPDLHKALNELSIIPLHSSVDFSDFEEYAVYYRGRAHQKVELPRLLKKKEVEVDSFERVAVLLRFKDGDHFATRKTSDDTISFEPGKAYLSLYKNVPRRDLELLFPNVKVWMTWKDRMLFFGPLLAALGPMIIKILPSAGLLIGLIALYVAGPEMAHEFDFDEKKHLALWPILFAVLSISMLFGGFAVKQYLNYKNKKLQFLKRITDTLFFKNLVSNRGVLMTVVDSAEEELGKEMVLAYYHLLAHGPKTREQLGQLVEAWLRDTCGRDTGFDVDKALKQLSQAVKNGGGRLITCVEGKWTAAPLVEGKKYLDESWDNIFRYGSQQNR